MGELFRRSRPESTLPWTGERLVSGVSGSIESEHLHRYFLSRELCRGKRVLDIASGEGYGTALLAQTALHATGVDVDQQSVDYASQTYQAANLRYVQGEACRLPLEDRSLDMVVSFETLEHFWNHRAFFEEVRRVLIPDGLLVISTPDSDVYSGTGSVPNPFHVKELTKAEFCDILDSSFQNVLLLQQRIFAGSAMVPNTIASSGKTFVFEQRDTDAFESYGHLPKAPYLIAVASNGAVPAIDATLYIQNEGLEKKNGGMEAELDRLRQVEAAAREQAPVFEQAFRDAAAAREESARLNTAMASLQAELDRLRQVETAAREQAPVFELALREAAAAREESARLNTAMASLQAELDRLRQVETVAREEDLAATSQRSEFARLQEAEAVARERIAFCAVLEGEVTEARRDAEAVRQQLNTTNLVNRQQTLVIQRLQHQLTEQIQSSQLIRVDRENTLRQADMYRTACREFELELARSREEFSAKHGSLREEFEVRYSSSQKALEEKLRVAREELSQYEKSLAQATGKLAASQAEVLRCRQTLDEVAGLIVPVWVRKLFPRAIRRPVQLLKQKTRAQTHGPS